jgi:hypothetical protein
MLTLLSQELCQGYMLERLTHALFLAIHGLRNEVQEQDFALLPSQEMQSSCNIRENYHGKKSFGFLGCSCFLSSSCGIVWHWPEDNCLGILPPGSGRQIIRRLAYKAGINQMSDAAFNLAEIELLHTAAVLLVDAYESSVQMAKNARYLTEDEPLSYRQFPDSIDAFYVPPPPSSFKPSDVDEGPGSHSDEEESLLYTIVPGQISAAANRRNFPIHKVYGDSDGTDGLLDDAEIERYYKDPDCDNSVHSGCSSDESGNESGTLLIRRLGDRSRRQFDDCSDESGDESVIFWGSS